MIIQEVNEPIGLMKARGFSVLKRGVLSLILVLLCGLPFSGVVVPDTAEAFCQTSTTVLASSLATTCWECMFPISMSGLRSLMLVRTTRFRRLDQDVPRTMGLFCVGVCASTVSVSPDFPSASGSPKT